MAPLQTSILLFPVDLAIRRVQLAQACDFGVPLICMHPLSIYEMLNIGIVWIFHTLFSSGLPGSRSTLWCWAWPRLPSMLAPQVVPRTPSLCFCHHQQQQHPSLFDVEIRACSRSVWLATPVKPCIPSQRVKHHGAPSQVVQSVPCLEMTLCMQYPPPKRIHSYQNLDSWQIYFAQSWPESVICFGEDRRAGLMIRTWGR